MGDARTPQDHQTKADPRAVKRVKLGGKSRLLRFDANAIIELSDIVKLDDVEDILTAASNLNFRVLRAMVWAGLLHEDPDLELEEVGAWLGDGPGLTTISDALKPVLIAFSAAIGADEAEMSAAMAEEPPADGARPTRRGGTGTRSSAQRSSRASRTPSSGD